MIITIIQFYPPAVEIINGNWRRTCITSLRQEIGTRTIQSKDGQTAWQRFKQPNSTRFFE